MSLFSPFFTDSVVMNLFVRAGVMLIGTMFKFSHDDDVHISVVSYCINMMKIAEYILMLVFSRLSFILGRKRVIYHNIGACVP